MSHERLAQLMQAQWDAIEADPEARTTHATNLSILVAVEKGDVTEGRALRILGYQAMRMADTATQAALYRQAAANLRQMRAWGAVIRPTLDRTAGALLADSMITT